MNASNDQNQLAIAEQRLPYERPDLVEAGSIGEATQSIGGNNGSDSAYT